MGRVNSSDARGAESAKSKRSGSWFRMVGRLIILLAMLSVVYLGGAVAGRVLFVKGVLRDGSMTLECLSALYTPLDGLFGYSPLFKSGFEGCVGLFLQDADVLPHQ